MIPRAILIASWWRRLVAHIFDREIYAMCVNCHRHARGNHACLNFKSYIWIHDRRKFVAIKDRIAEIGRCQ